MPGAMALAGLLPSLDDVLRELHRRSFYKFFKHFWADLEPAAPYIEARHTEVVCDHFQAVYEGVIPKLSVEIGPGYGKSLIAVAFVAWAWGPRGDPGYRFGFSTYADDLTTRDSAKCRDLILCERYQQLYGHVFQLTKVKEDYLKNNRGGYRVALSTKGKATGYRFNLWVGDDLLNMLGAYSEAERRTMRVHLKAIATRGQIGKPYYRIVIGQRLHEEDAGGLAREQGFTVLCLPTEYDPSRRCVTPIFQEWRVDRGELLFEPGFGPEKVQAAKDDLGPVDYSAQHQQMPVPEGGGDIKTEYIKMVRASEGVRTGFRFMSVDTCQGQSEKNDTYGLTVFGARETDMLLVDGWSGREPSPLFIQRLKNMAAIHKPTTVVIEQKDWGKALTQILQEDPTWRWHITEFMPIGSKNMRAHAALPHFYKRRVAMLEGTPLAEQALAQLSVFPAGKVRDLADSIVQAALHAQSSYTFEKHEAPEYHGAPRLSRTRGSIFGPRVPDDDDDDDD